MTFVTCPQCKHVISARATSCVNCGTALPGMPESVDVANLASPNAPSTTAPAANQPVATPAYFAVGERKFMVMCFATFGLYEIFWAFHQWTRIRAQTGEDLSPWWRAFFGHLWGFSLFGRIQQDALAKGLTVGWDSRIVAFSYLVVVVLLRLPDPWWLLCLFSFVPMLPVVRLVNRLNAASTTPRPANAELSGANVAAVVLGFFVLALAILGLVQPPVTPP